MTFTVKVNEILSEVLNCFCLFSGCMPSSSSSVYSVVELLSHLCLTQDESTQTRVGALLSWLQEAANNNLKVRAQHTQPLSHSPLTFCLVRRPPRECLSQTAGHLVLPMCTPSQPSCGPATRKMSPTTSSLWSHLSSSDCCMSGQASYQSTGH